MRASRGCTGRGLRADRPRCMSGPRRFSRPRCVGRPRYISRARTISPCGCTGSVKPTRGRLRNGGRVRRGGEHPSDHTRQHQDNRGTRQEGNHDATQTEHNSPKTHSLTCTQLALEHRVLLPTSSRSRCPVRRGGRNSTGRCEPGSARGVVSAPDNRLAAQGRLLLRLGTSYQNIIKEIDGLLLLGGIAPQWVHRSSTLRPCSYRGVNTR
jgi:hypothetical protein